MNLAGWWMMKQLNLYAAVPLRNKYLWISLSQQHWFPKLSVDQRASRFDWIRLSSDEIASINSSSVNTISIKWKFCNWQTQHFFQCQWSRKWEYAEKTTTVCMKQFVNELKPRPQNPRNKRVRLEHESTVTETWHSSSRVVPYCLSIWNEVFMFTSEQEFFSTVSFVTSLCHYSFFNQSAATEDKILHLKLIK